MLKRIGRKISNPGKTWAESRLNPGSRSRDQRNDDVTKSDDITEADDAADDSEEENASQWRDFSMVRD